MLEPGASSRLFHYSVEVEIVAEKEKLQAIKYAKQILYFRTIHWVWRQKDCHGNSWLQK